MASCTTKQWADYAPQVTLTVNQTSSTDTIATLSWTLQYIASYAADTNGTGRSYTVTIAGDTVKSGSYNIHGKTGTYTIASGTKNITKTTSAQNISFDVSFDFNLTWSGVYQGTSSASSSISVGAKKSYTVSYNANGGSGAPSAQTKWYGTNLTLSTTKPTKTGYTFSKWNTNSSGTGTNYNSGATYTANSSATLYALWTANTYTVSYNANGGSGAPSNQTKTYGVALTLSTTKPTRTNYNFLGWGTSSSATTVAYASGSSYTQNSAITLYAIWELAYTKPRITGVSVKRCDSDGTTNEEGTYASVSFSWECDSATVAYNISVSPNTTSEGTTIPGASDVFPTSGPTTIKTGTATRIIGNGLLSIDTTYTIKIMVADVSNHSNITRTLSGARYSIDFLAGGNGVAFNKPAEKQGSAEFNLDIYDKYGTIISNGLSLYTGSGDDAIDPNTTIDHCILTDKNTPTSSLWYVLTYFHASKNENRSQLAFPYNSTGPIFHRYYYNEIWSSWFNTALDSYPVNSIYISYDHISPASKFGGTWVRISNRFLWGCGSNETIGTTGGERTHTLTVSEMPSHAHGIANTNTGGYTQTIGTTPYAGTVGYTGNINTTDTGGGAAHNNMPPYMYVSIWRRTE